MTEAAIDVPHYAEVKNGDDDLRRLRDEVLQLVRSSAEAEGRVVSLVKRPMFRPSALSMQLHILVGDNVRCIWSQGRGRGKLHKG